MQLLTLRHQQKYYNKSIDMKKEVVLFEGTPSQWMNFTTYVMAVLFCWLIFPLFIALYRYLLTRTMKFKITSKRIEMEKGILSISHDETELFRVRDISMKQPFWLRLVGLSTIILATSDSSSRYLRIAGIKADKTLMIALRDAIEERRAEKNVRELDVV
jgi:uncharacterized membrane protein YdbT with pleckstrin-like domain